MRKYSYQTRTGHFSISELDGQSHVEYDKTYIGAFPTSAIAARAVGTGERWPAEKPRPDCAKEVPVYLENWISMWVNMNRLPGFPHRDPGPASERAGRINAAPVAANDVRGQAALEAFKKKREEIEKKYANELWVISTPPHFALFWVLGGLIIAAVLSVFMTGPHADTDSWFCGAIYGFVPGMFLHGMVRKRRMGSRKYRALEIARDAELTELQTRYRWVSSAINAERK